jgi:hypothetical protein
MKTNPADVGDTSGSPPHSKRGWSSFSLPYSCVWIRRWTGALTLKPLTCPRRRGNSMLQVLHVLLANRRDPEQNVS